MLKYLICVKFDPGLMCNKLRNLCVLGGICNLWYLNAYKRLSNHLGRRFCTTIIFKTPIQIVSSINTLFSNNVVRMWIDWVSIFFIKTDLIGLSNVIDIQKYLYKHTSMRKIVLIKIIIFYYFYCNTLPIYDCPIKNIDNILSYIFYQFLVPKIV